MGHPFPWGAVALAAATLACAQPNTPHLTMATTTSVGNSGLLDELLSAYKQERGTDVQAHLVGSGRALAMLSAGTAAVVVSHAPEAERRALERHPRWWYRKIMFNDFVIVGPSADLAGVGQALNAEEGMRRIAASSARFISRGDQSGTHERELALWSQAGARPDGDRLVIAGAGMGTTLRVASEAGAYTLTNRATFAQHAGSLRLRILLEKDPELLNTYAVIVNRASPRATDALAFGEWLASGRGREVIRDYHIAGTRIGFEPWPLDRPAASPEDRPR